MSVEKSKILLQAAPNEQTIMAEHFNVSVMIGDAQNAADKLVVETTNLLGKLDGQKQPLTSNS